MENKETPGNFRSRKEAILEAIREFVAVESPSGDNEGSRAAVDLLVAQARKILCVSSIERIAAGNLGEHILIRAFQNLPGKQTLILGHTDTVHPRGASAKNPIRIEDGRFYGCGIFDMKANCILALEILRALDESKISPKRPVTILFTCDEEIGSHSGREFVEREALNSEFCLVLEPSSQGCVKTSRKGTALFTLLARGVPAHAGLEPEKGASAILEVARQIEKLQSLNAPEKGTTVNVCQMKGGTASNVIPAFAECTIDVRFSKLDEAKRIEEAIRGLKPFDERVRLEIAGEINRPPLERTEAVAAIYAKARAIAAKLRNELGEAQAGGASDGNFVGALGIPVLDGLGIKGDGAHTFDEFILVDDIEFRGALLFDLLLI